MDMLKVDQDFARRYVNDGFSGGEKKRAEMLQMAMLEPSMAVLDETDSGLDIDALRTVAEGVNTLMNPEMGLLLITHYQRLLNYIKPQFVHVLVDGRIVKSGGPNWPIELEAAGLRRDTKPPQRRGDRLRRAPMTAPVKPYRSADDYEGQVGLPRQRGSALQVATRASTPEIVRDDLGDEGRAAVDARLPAALARDFPREE